MKKIDVGDLIRWNGAAETLEGFCSWLESQPYLDDRHARLLSDLTEAYNSFVEDSETNELEF